MSHQLLTITNSLPIGNLEAYIQRVNQIPMLSVEEEKALAEDLQQNNNLDSARQLVLAHLRYVVRVAKGYSGYGLALSDLIQEGNIGLMKAVKRFDPNMGVRLVSFAVHWIKAEMHEFVLKNWRIVKVATTKAQRKLFFNLRSMKKRLGWFTNEEVNAVAKDLGVTSKEVLLMEQRLNAMDSPYDGPEPDDENAYAHTPAHFLEDHTLNPATLLELENNDENERYHLTEALNDLDERSRDILQTRWLNEKKATLHDLAAKYGVSAERIRQLEKNAMQKMRSQLEAAA